MPNKRYLQICSNKKGVDSIVDAILASDTSPEFLLYSKARSISLSPTKKGYLEASLLCDKDLAKIANLLEMPIEVVTMYRDIFYNVSEYDKLSKLDLIANTSDVGEKSMKTWALSQGLNFVSWRLGNLVNISPVEGLQEMFTTCIFKSKEALFSGNISEASKESTKWVKLSMDLARLIKVWVMDSAAAKKDLEMALLEVIPNFQGLDSLDGLIEKATRKDEPGAAELRGVPELITDQTDLSEQSLEDLLK
jgi:hypothetical protein